MSNLVQIIEKEFENTVPFIHKEADDSYLIVQRTPSMTRILMRVPSESLARQFVNKFINDVINKGKGSSV